MDKSVAEATAQRKEENGEFMTILTDNNAAIDLIEMAKNRLNQFYNPVLYTAPAKRELSEQDRITQNMGGQIAPAPAALLDIFGGDASFVQVHMHTLQEEESNSFQHYQKQNEESGGVIAMMDTLKQDLVKEVTEAKAEEKDSQQTYELMLAASKEKREADLQAITEKEGNKAGVDEELSIVQHDHKAKMKELGATVGVLAQLHEECDFLIKAYEMRKTSRANEVEGLKKGKSVLAGADISLVQTSHLRGH